MTIEQLVSQLRGLGFTVIETDGGVWYSVRLDGRYDHTEVLALNKYVSHWFRTEESMIYMEQEQLEVLLPLVFNYILQNISKNINQTIYQELKDRVTLEQEREHKIGSLLEETDTQNQLIEQLASLDRRLTIKDDYMDGYIIRMVDLIAILREYGYEKSRLEGTTLTVMKDTTPLIRMDTERQMDIHTFEAFEQLPANDREKLQILVTGYGATPIPVRKLPFSFLERAIIAVLPKQFRWIKREEGIGESRLYAYSGLSKNAVKEEVKCDPSLFRMVTLSNPLPTYLSRGSGV